MAEDIMLKMGFEFVKKYNHDHYYTNQYKKGVLKVEFTYEGDYLLSNELTIDEIVALPFSLSELKVLDKILNKDR